MNQLLFEGSFAPGTTHLRLGGVDIPCPALRDGAEARRLVLGVRPEHVAITDDGAYRARVVASEYLGTTQIVTLDSPHGAVKARVPSSRVVRTGDTIGLTFAPGTLSVFDAGTGRAFRTAANEGVLHHG
jgi:multiple sugar transport system ATP-binding protein